MPDVFGRNDCEDPAVQSAKESRVGQSIQLRTGTGVCRLGIARREDAKLSGRERDGEASWRDSFRCYMTCRYGGAGQRCSSGWDRGCGAYCPAAGVPRGRRGWG